MWGREREGKRERERERERERCVDYTNKQRGKNKGNSTHTATWRRYMINFSNQNLALNRV